MSRSGVIRSTIGIALQWFVFAANAANNEGFPAKDTLDASIYRGSIVYEKYCQKCHGVLFDGNGRAAKLYDPKPANLLLSDKPPEYKALIVKVGGAKVGRSQFMPAWDEELTDEQMGDVVNFLQSIQQKKQ